MRMHGAVTYRMLFPRSILPLTHVLSRHVREELNSEAMQFVKEQRIRCLLQGAWFPVSAPLRQRSAKIHIETIPWRYVRLSHNRRYLHYCDYENETSYEPKLEELPEKR
jgi:engulfment/cell motility protein 1